MLVITKKYLPATDSLALGMHHWVAPNGGRTTNGPKIFSRQIDFSPLDKTKHPNSKQDCLEMLVEHLYYKQSIIDNDIVT